MSLAEQGVPHGAPEEKEAGQSLVARSGFTGGLKSCCLCMQGEDKKGQSSVRVETGQSCTWNKKGFFKYIDSKRSSKENVGLILFEDHHLSNTDEDKAGAFSASVASVFNNTGRLWAAQSSESEGRSGKSDFAFVATEIARNQLYQLNVHKSLGTEGIHHKVSKELVDIASGPLSIIDQMSWEPGEVVSDWKLANVIPIYKKGMSKDPGNYRPASLTSVPGKIMEKMRMAAIERHLKNNAVISQSHQGFTQGKSCITNLICFYIKVTHLVDERKAVASAWGSGGQLPF